MGLGDVLEGTFHVAGKALDVAWHAAPPVALAGFAVDVATSPWNDDEGYNGFWNTLISRGATRIGDILEPLDIAGGSADEAAIGAIVPQLERAWSYGVARPITTAILSGDENVGTHSGSLLNPGNWREAWNASKDISPGQAFSEAWLGGAGVVADSLGVDPETISPVAKLDFDITDPVDRAAFRDGGSVAQLLSGAIDARLRWTMDPTVLALGGIGAVRQATVVKPLGTTGTKEWRGFTGREGQQYGGASYRDIGRGPISVDDALNSKRVTGLVDELAAMDKATRADFLARQRTFRGNVGVQTLLTGADDAEEMRLVLKYAMDKSMRNREQLATKRADLADQVEMLQDVRIPALERVLAGSYKPAYAERVTPAQLEMANRQLANTDRQYQYARNLEMAEGGLTNVPRVTVGGRVADRLDWAIYQPSRLNMPMRVLKSAGTMRAGVIDYNRSGHATEQVRRMLDRVGHAQDLTRLQPQRWTPLGVGLRPGTGLSQREKGVLLQAVSKAETLGPEALETAIRNAEMAVLRHHAARHGVSTEMIEELAKTSWARMDEARASMSGSGFGGRFTGAKKVDAEGKPTNRYLDEVDDDGTGVRHRPIMNSEQANVRPLLDVDGLARIVGRNKAALQGEEAAFLARLRGDAVLQRSTLGVVEEALDSFNRFWKPAQLTRLGWPLRVITDEQLRIMATIGAFTHLPLVMDSVKNSVTQSKLNYRVRDAATAAGRRAPRRELDELAPARAQEMKRLGLVERVTKLDARLAKLDARIATQRTRIQGFSDEFDAYRVAAVRDRDVAAVYGSGGTLGVAPRPMTSPGLEQARLRLRALQQQRDVVAGARAQTLWNSQVITPWGPEMYARWDELNDLVLTPTQRRELAGGRERKFAGKVTSRDRNGTIYTHDDAMAGEIGEVFMDLSSSKGAMRTFAMTQDRYLNMMRAKAGRPTLIHPVPPDDLMGHKLKAYKANYDTSWTRAVNDQIGKDNIGKRILAGMDDDQIVAWLRKSPEGREMRRMNPTRGRDPERWVQEVRIHVDHYLPTDELRVLAAQGRATADDLRTAVPNIAHRPEIHGESLTNALDGSPFWQTWDLMVDTVYRKLGAAPTDVLSRHPYFAGIYRQEMRAQIGAIHLAEDAIIPSKVIEQMQNRARQSALNKTRENLYELSNQSNLAHTLKFITPFYSAWQEALTTWGRLWMEDPSRLMRMSQMWEAPSKAHLTYTDSNGREYFVLPLPQGIREAIPGGLGEVGIPKYWMKDLIAQGNYWMTPGVGAPVTVPLAALTRERPDLYPLLKPLLPYGAGESMLDEILPAGWRRGVSLYNKEDDYAYAQAKLRIVMDLETDRRLGKNAYTPEELYAEARRRTDDFFRVRMFANFALPFAPNYRSPYQFYIDQAKTLREEYYQLPGAKDTNGKTWEERYLDLYGEDYFIFTGSATKTNVGGVAPTTEGYQATKKYRDLIATNPDLGGLIVGDDDEGEYSSEVYQWQRGERIGPGTNERMRDLVSPEDAVKGVQIRRGWSEYMKVNNALNAALFARGLRTFEAAKAKDLKAARQVLIASLEAKYPAWAEERQTFTIGKANKTIQFLEEHIDDERFTGRAGFGTLVEYLATRKAFVAALGQRQVHNLQAKDNDDLRAAWEVLVGQMKEKDLAFSDIYDRWLDNDRMEDGGK